jgi:hypothetical protein
VEGIYWCVALGYGLDDREFEFWQGLAIFLFTTASRPALGPTPPPIQWVPGALSQRVKRPGREADHSPPYSAEVKNEWIYISTPQYISIAWYSVKESTRTILSLLYFTYVITGGETDCCTYRGMPLLPTTYAVLSSILLLNLTPYVEDIIEDHKCGFRRNRSIADQILCIRQKLEKLTITSISCQG